MESYKKHRKGPYIVSAGVIYKGGTELLNPAVLLDLSSTTVRVLRIGEVLEVISYAEQMHAQYDERGQAECLYLLPFSCEGKQDCYTVDETCTLINWLSGGVKSEDFRTMRLLMGDRLNEQIQQLAEKGY